MSMPAMHERRWTAAEVRRLIEEQPGPTPRLELVRGALLVTPSPSKMHQRIVGALFLKLAPYVAENRIGEMLSSPSDVRLNPDSILQPDLFVEPWVGGRRPPTANPIVQLLLAIEVLSPSSARYDRIDKRREYQHNGISEYWIVDPDARMFERWTPPDDRPEVLDRELVWRPHGTSEPFVLDVARFFAEVSDDAN